MANTSLLRACKAPISRIQQEISLALEKTRPSRWFFCKLLGVIKTGYKQERSPSARQWPWATARDVSSFPADSVNTLPVRSWTARSAWSLHPWPSTNRPTVAIGVGIPDPASYGGEISSCWRRSCVLGWVSRMERIPFAGRGRSSLSRMERRTPLGRFRRRRIADASRSASSSKLRE